MKFLNDIEDASRLVQDSTHRLVTDAEKAMWNDKASAAAESARAQTFTTNEAGRQSTFASNEATRETNETARKAAEAARAETFGQWADTQADWAADEATRASAETSRATAEGLRATAETGRVNAESARVTTEQGRVSAEAARVTAENNRQATIDAKVPKTTTVNGKALSANISVTAADVPNTPAGGIAATTVQAALNELDSEKANKTQEAWKAPTLTNGATSASGYPITYYKDEMGIVHLRGRSTGHSVGLSHLTFPVGYRTNQSLVFLQKSQSGYTDVSVMFNGQVYIGSGGSWVSLDGISFRAEG